MTLEGVQILDFSRVIQGTFCTPCCLGDLGAEVLKIEAPGVIEFMGHRDCFKGKIKRKKTAYYVLIATKNIVVNLKLEAGREIFYRLSQHADVIV